ncbi:hypothetical protein ACJIZ3_017419 [Penstemon smallii]|uniref:Aluminum-activated malate transporter n=1 Tax=Penstemon smallii TaxID=265156 RepID=A0ABD3SVG8_9LAMI
MEMENVEKVSIFVSGWLWIKGIPLKLLAKINEIAMQTKNIVKDDPRKLIHSLKVGLAITLVSLFYYFQPLYSSFGVSAMWAVMTVVVVFEFSVGATLGKGLNRGLATFAAGALGLGAHHLASITGKTCEPILIGLFVFIQAVASTFIRFFPKVKARYDYGMLIFILTFCFVSISGYRSDEILDLAQKRLSTILIGASTCLIVSILVCPVWAGEDLHLLVYEHWSITTINFIFSYTGFADECFRKSDRAEMTNGRSSSLVGCLNGVLDSKSSEETLANFARWEPCHGKFMYRHPWKQYLMIGTLTRQCACRVEALNGYYLNSKTQVAKQEIRRIIEDPLFSMSSEAGKALKDLAVAIQTMSKPSSPNPHIANLKIASQNLKSLLKSDLWYEHTDLLEVVPVASLLIETVILVENIYDAVNELSSLANFKCRDSNGVLCRLQVKGNNNKKVYQVSMDDDNIHIPLPLPLPLPHISIVIDAAGEDHAVKQQGSKSEFQRATLGKGVNRGIATLLGGASATTVTFIRFFPKLKARYDYGLMIFILTFSLISVSGYREDEVIKMANRRLSTILIGGLVTICICVFICPIWAGEDLHKLIASSFGHEYFEMPNDNKDYKEKKTSLDAYKSVLNSKGIEDSLVSTGTLGTSILRLDPLHENAHTTKEIRTKIQEPCTKMSSECSYALNELAIGIKTMTSCSLSADPHIRNAKTAAKKLKSSLKTGLWPETDLLDLIPAATVASLLIEIVSCTVKIADSVHELASLSKFKILDPSTPKHKGSQKLTKAPSIEQSHNFGIAVE